MSGNNADLQALKSVEAYVPPAVRFAASETPGDSFGENLFGTSVIRMRLPKSVYKSVLAASEHALPLEHRRRGRLVFELDTGSCFPPHCATRQVSR